jgi:hypothetical protein
MRVLFYNLGLLYVKEVSDDRKSVVLDSVLPLSSPDIVNILIRAYTEAPVLANAKYEAYCNNGATLAKDISEELSIVVKGIQATHRNLPLDGLNERAVQDRIQGTLIHKFNHARIRLVRELYVGAHKKGWMDFLFAINNPVEEEFGRCEVAPLNDPNWRKKPSNKLPWRLDSILGIIIEVKMGVKQSGRHNMELPTTEATRSAQHRSDMLSGLRQAWAYRDRNGLNPKNVWLMGLTFWWGENYDLTVTYCAGEFAGNKDDTVEDPYSNEALKEVLKESDLDKKGVISGEHTIS